MEAWLRARWQYLRKHMEAWLRARWQYLRKHWVVALIIVLTILFALFVFTGYWFSWRWTGFNPSIGPNVQQYQPGKTLWDWLQLLGVLAIPAAVGLGTIWFTAQQGKVSDAENKDNQREAALQAYIDKMSELLLEKKLRESDEEDEVRKIARVRTLTILPRLDASRKRSVLQFLYESGLINKDKRIVDLSEADLSEAELIYMNLSEADLGSVNLKKANLFHANLSGANLTLSVLTSANMSLANLNRANLEKAFLDGGADLSFADLSGANLKETILKGTILKEAIVTSQQLVDAKFLEGVVMPDGTIHS